MTAEAPGAHRAQGRSPVTALFVGAGLAWARPRALAALRPPARVQRRLLRTVPGAFVCCTLLPLAAAVAVWLAWPDPAARDADTDTIGTARIVEHMDTAPCRRVSGGRCDVRADLVHVPATGPTGGGRGG